MGATFFACLGLGLEIGILVGVATNVLMLVIFSAMPTIDVSKVEV
jgi:MFS superfamily sulfate permease-like transporter